MRFIPVKTVDQQAILMVHRLRRQCVAAHTRSINQLRGFLAEFGVVAPKGVNTFKARWSTLRQQHDTEVPPLARTDHARRALCARGLLKLNPKIPAQDVA